MSKIEGIKLNGTVLEIETGSNVDIHIEDDTLVINTDGTSSGSGSSGGTSGGSGLTKLSYTVPNEKISVTYLRMPSANPPSADKVVVLDNGLQEFITNNKDSLFMRFIFESEIDMGDMGLFSVKNVFEVVSRVSMDAPGMTQERILLGRSTTYYITDAIDGDDDNISGALNIDAGGVYTLNDSTGESTPNCFMMQCMSTSGVSQQGGSMTITVECYKVE